MLTRLYLTLIIAVVPVAGCLESGGTVKTGETPPIDTSAGMIKYLQQAHLPAVKSVQRWENKYGNGLKISTAHYEVYTTLLEPLMLSQVPGFIESAYRGYNRQISESIETGTKFKIYLFAERKQWEAFTEEFAGRRAELYLKITAGAYYLNGAVVAYNIGRERTFSVLGHEGWHQFNSRHFKFRLPSWLDEGVAMLFESARYEGGLFYFEPADNLYRLGTLKNTITAGEMIPLKQLVGMNPGEVLADDRKFEPMAFYSQSYALVRFLREEGYGKRMNNYQKMLLGGLWGTWPLTDSAKRIAADRNIPMTVGWNRLIGVTLFKYYISGDFEQIEKEYRAFCGKIVYHVHFRQ